MEVRQTILLFIGCLLVLGGCQNPRTRPQLEQELRMQEDRIYQLQDCLQETRAALEACSQENEALRKKSPGNQYSEAPRHESESAGDSTELNIEMPLPNSSSGQMPKMFQDGGSSGSSESNTSSPQGVVPGGGDSAPPAWTEPVPTPIPSDTFQDQPAREGPAINSSVHSEAATQIEVGDLALERPVDGEGISMMVIPRDEHGVPLAAPAPVSVVVVDPSLSGPAARVARWDFSAEQMASLFDTTRSDEGFRLRLKWPDQGGPQHKELHMFVRYETADGRKLHTEIPFDMGRLVEAKPPRRAPRSIARWQRRKRRTSQQPMTREPAPRWSGGTDANMTDAPAWGGVLPPSGTTSQAPPFNSHNSEVSSDRLPQDKSPQGGVSRQKPPSWSPERN